MNLEYTNEKIGIYVSYTMRKKQLLWFQKGKSTMNKIEITWNKKCPQRLGTGGGGPAPGRLGSRGGGPLGGLAGGGPGGGTDGGPPPNSNGGGRLGTCGGPGSSLFVGVALPLSVSVLEEFEMLSLRAVST